MLFPTQFLLCSMLAHTDLIRKQLTHPSACLFWHIVHQTLAWDDPCLFSFPIRFGFYMVFKGRAGSIPYFLCLTQRQEGEPFCPSPILTLLQMRCSLCRCRSLDGIDAAAKPLRSWMLFLELITNHRDGNSIPPRLSQSLFLHLLLPDESIRNAKA